MNEHQGISTSLALLFSVTAGLAVGNLYWAQPLLSVIADDFGDCSFGGCNATPKIIVKRYDNDGLSTYSLCFRSVFLDFIFRFSITWNFYGIGTNNSSIIRRLGK